MALLAAQSTVCHLELRRLSFQFEKRGEFDLIRLGIEIECHFFLLRESGVHKRELTLFEKNSLITVLFAKSDCDALTHRYLHLCSRRAF